MLDFDVLSIAFFAIIYILFVVYLKYFKRKNLNELFILTLFYTYLVLVIKYTQYPVIFEDVYVEDFRGYSANYNLVPLISLTRGDVRTSILNIVLFLPFGFLYFIISKFSFRKTMVIGFLISFFIEISQLIIAVTTKVYFRVSDINDIFFNVFGVLLGVFCYFIFYIIIKKTIKILSIHPNELLKLLLKEY